MASQVFRTKSPDHLIEEAAAPDRLMKRSLTALDLTCLGIGAIIGAGIFALAGTDSSTTPTSSLVGQRRDRRSLFRSLSPPSRAVSLLSVTANLRP